MDQRQRALSGAADLADLAADADRPGRLVDECLDIFAESLPHDAAVYLALADGALEPRQRRGVDRPGVPDDGTARRLRDALSDGRVVPLSADAVRRLAPGVDATGGLAVPVYAADRQHGIIVVLRRDGPFDEPAAAVAATYGRIVGLGVDAAERARQLDAYRERLQEHNRLLEEAGDVETHATAALERLPSRRMRRLSQMARQVAVTDAPILITGETGAGKEVVARAIHDWSRRADGGFVQLNCAALPENLIESELFGHRRGAFSGAIRDRPGRFRVADGGTLLLDEIGDMPLATQAKLLRVLQEGCFEPVGGDRPVRVDVRVIAATNRDLERALDEGSFREDLYYRLDVLPLEVPPLRDRREDIPALCELILERIRRRTGRGPWRVGDDSLDRMAAHSWPGNVRELVNALERARAFAHDGGTIEVRLDRRGRAPRRPAAPERWPSLDAVQRDHIVRALRHTGGRVYGPEGAAALLELPPTTLQSRMKKLGVDRRAVAAEAHRQKSKATPSV